MAREQVLTFGDVRVSRTDEGDNLYFLAGKRMYVIGAMSGEYPPLGWRRPGFLVGKSITQVGEDERPTTAAHYLYEMGGVWAHPIKAIESIKYALAPVGEDWWELNDSLRFVNHLSHGEFFFERGNLSVRRRDFVVEEEPSLFSLLQISNRGDRALHLRLRWEVETNLMPSWFSGWRNGEDLLVPAENLVFATDAYWALRWATVFGTDATPVQRDLSVDRETNHGKAVQVYELEVPAGGEVEVPFQYVVESTGGRDTALARYNQLMGHQHELLAEKMEYYDEQVLGQPKFSSSDPSAVEAFLNAKANLVQLKVDYSPYLGKYLLAGLPEYVQLFGTDTAYSIPGIVGIGQLEWARESLLQLAKVGQRQCGRIPHEVTTNGRVFHPGNTQETPQFTIAAWEYFRWTGDYAFLEEVYPLCQEGVLDYVLAHWDADLDYYPDGNAMVERQGMGPEKLDSIAYFCQAVYCLASMAGALGRDYEAENHLELASALRAAVNQDFWIEEESIFADSLADDHTKRMDGHWVVVTPLQAGVADRDKAERALRRIEQEWVNEYGMIHTRDVEELVWTLPTGLLALAAFYQGKVNLGWRLLANIAQTTMTGSLGTYKELIPEGLCFMQLWSPALFLQGIIEGMFGVQPKAHIDFTEICPKLPDSWTHAELEGLRIGAHTIDLRIEREDSQERIRIGHQGAKPLDCRIRLEVDGEPRVRTSDGHPLAAEQDRRRRDTIFVGIRLANGEVAEVLHMGNEVVVSANTVATPVR